MTQGRPLTARQRAALTAVDLGQITPHHPPPRHLSRLSLQACRTRGWWEASPTGEAKLTPAGRQKLAEPIPDQPRMLHTGLVASDNRDRCADCGHVRGEHLVELAQDATPTGRHIGCMHTHHPRAGAPIPCRCQLFRPPDVADDAHDHGYTAGRDILDAGEAVDQSTLRRFVAEARQRHHHRILLSNGSAEQARRLLTLDDRLLALRDTARQRHIDMSREIRLIRRMITSRQDARAERYLRAGEQRLDSDDPTHGKGTAT